MASARWPLDSSSSSSRPRFLAPLIRAGIAGSPSVALAVNPGSSVIRRRNSARTAVLAKKISSCGSGTFGKGKRKVKSGFMFAGIPIGSDGFGEDIITVCSKVGNCCLFILSVRFVSIWEGRRGGRDLVADRRHAPTCP